MSSGPRDSSSNIPGLEAESTERWISGKSEEELLADLRAYSSRLRDDPHSIPDRLRVAAIQLRLGRIEEALVHYEGVLRGYVSKGQVMSAIALCRRILSIYPDLPRLQRILAALYARVPHGASDAPTPVTPIDEDSQGSFVMHDEGGTPGGVVADSISSGNTGLKNIPTTRDLLTSRELEPSANPYHRERRLTGPVREPVLLTRKKARPKTLPPPPPPPPRRLTAEEERINRIPTEPEGDTPEPVVLLTKRKPR